MLRKEAVITVYGLQEDEEGIGEPITVVTPGHFYRKNGIYYGIYDETVNYNELEYKNGKYVANGDNKYPENILWVDTDFTIIKNAGGLKWHVYKKPIINY